MTFWHGALPPIMRPKSAERSCAHGRFGKPPPPAPAPVSPPFPDVGPVFVRGPRSGSSFLARWRGLRCFWIRFRRWFFRLRFSHPFHRIVVALAGASYFSNSFLPLSLSTGTLLPSLRRNSHVAVLSLQPIADGLSGLSD